MDGHGVRRIGYDFIGIADVDFRYGLTDIRRKVLQIFEGRQDGLVVDRIAQEQRVYAFARNERYRDAFDLRTVLDNRLLWRGFVRLRVNSALVY